jgi:trans-2,3-dihydro-3-hydroxyanthranilate isomerase
MAVYEFVTVDVFTDRRFGGNPLAVFPDARGLSSEQMQALAMEFNLSETTFVLPPENPQHHAKVRIFTPRSELPFAGHPNVGTGYVLSKRDANPPEHYVFEELAGLVRVHVLPNGARISAPRALSIDIGIPSDVIAACAGLAQAEIASNAHEPLVASVGTPFVIAEVASVAALSRASPDIGAFRAAAQQYPEVATRFSLLLYARRDGEATRLAARMFAPLGGILEDPATGSANAALAALLTSLAPGENADLSYEIVQGVEMGRPSQIIASARKTAEGPVLASVEGNCVPVLKGSVEL